jgi:hypothetical protein
LISPTTPSWRSRLTLTPYDSASAQNPGVLSAISPMPHSAMSTDWAASKIERISGSRSRRRRSRSISRSETRCCTGRA